MNDPGTRFACNDYGCPIKSGMTTEGNWKSFAVRNRRRKFEPDTSGTSRGMTTEGGESDQSGFVLVD